MSALFPPLPKTVKRLALAVRAFVGDTIYRTYGLQLTATAAAYRHEGKVNSIVISAARGRVVPKNYWSFPSVGCHFVRANWAQDVPDDTFRPARTLNPGDKLYVFMPRRHRNNLYRRVQVGRFIRMTDDGQHGALKSDFGFRFAVGCPVYTEQGHIVGLVYGTRDHGPQTFFHRPTILFFTPIEDLLARADQIDGRTTERTYSGAGGQVIHTRVTRRTSPEEDAACEMLGLPHNASKDDILGAARFLLDHFGSDFDDDPPEVAARRRQQVNDALDTLKKNRRC